MGVIAERGQNFPFVEQISWCSYWDSGWDRALLDDRVALNLGYVQALSDLDRGWVLAPKETQRQLAALQAKGSKREVGGHGSLWVNRGTPCFQVCPGFSASASSKPVASLRRPLGYCLTVTSTNYFLKVIYLRPVLGPEHCEMSQ